MCYDNDLTYHFRALLIIYLARKVTKMETNVYNAKLCMCGYPQAPRYNISMFVYEG